MRLRVPFIVCVCIAQLLWLIVPLRAALAASPGLELSELLINPAAPQTDAHDEYIRFYNRGAEPLNLRNYGLTLLAGTTPKTYGLPDQLVPAGGSATVTATDASATWALGNSGGTITLLDATKGPLDTTAWPNADHHAGAVWAKSAAGSWGWTGAPAVVSTIGSGVVQGSSIPAAAAPTAELQLSELLPDPAAPATDAADEFIELYNPNPLPVNLAGYLVKTGANLTTKHMLPAATIAPAGYLALKSAATKIALGNSGSSIALFSPDGRQLGPTVSYPAAPTGQAWAWEDGQWAWTITATPGAVNVINAPAAATGPTAKTAAAPAKTKPSAAAKALASKPPKVTKTPAPKPTAPLVAAKTTTGGHWLLFALAGLTIAYIIYEFRYDLRNLYFRFRQHAGPGTTPGPAIEGASSYRASE